MSVCVRLFGRIIFKKKRAPTREKKNIRHKGNLPIKLKTKTTIGRKKCVFLIFYRTIKSITLCI